MKLKITEVAKSCPLIGGGSRQAVNVTKNGCAATITTRYEAIGWGNILSLAHYPRTVILYEYE